MNLQGSPLFWIAGLVLVVVIWRLSHAWPSRAWRVHARALALALGLGVAIVPGHGEAIVAPNTQLLLQGLASGSPFFMGIGFVFLLIHWIAALLALSLWKSSPAPTPGRP